MDITNQAIEKAADELPDGYEISLCIERDAGWVDLIDPSGEHIEFPTNRESIADQILDALRYAIDQAIACKRGE